MGMFDTVVIEGLKLPKLSKEVESFLNNENASLSNDYQTKDLENVLSTYKIDSRGQIFLIEYRPTGKKIPYKSPLSDWKDNRSFLERVYFKLVSRSLNKKFPLPKFTQERKEVRVKSNITSTFEIYNMKEVSGRYVDVSYIVTAVNGKVTDIKLEKSEIESVKSSKDRHKTNEEFNKKFAESIRKSTELRSKWYYPLLKEIYNPFIFFSAKTVQFICNKIISWSYRWSGV